MKGKLILTNIKEPKEGMKVVAGTDKLVGTVVKMFQEKHRYYDFDAMWNVLTPEDTYVYFTKELQQIAIECLYNDGAGMYLAKPPSLKQLPLSPDDYEKAIKLIGEEVVFDVYSSGIIENGKKIVKEEYAILSKPIAPSPIVYAEEEAYDLAVKATTAGIRFGAGTWFPDWWDKHKKK